MKNIKMMLREVFELHEASGDAAKEVELMVCHILNNEVTDDDKNHIHFSKASIIAEKLKNEVPDIIKAINTGTGSGDLKPSYGATSSKVDVLLETGNGPVGVSVKIGKQWVASSAQNPSEYTGIMQAGLEGLSEQVSQEIAEKFENLFTSLSKIFIGETYQRTKLISDKDAKRYAEHYKDHEKVNDYLIEALKKSNEEIKGKIEKENKKLISELNTLLNSQLEIKKKILFEALTATKKYQGDDRKVVKLLISDVEEPKWLLKFEDVPNELALKCKFNFRGLPKNRGDGGSVRFKKMMNKLGSDFGFDDFYKLFNEDLFGMVGMLKIDVREQEVLSEGFIMNMINSVSSALKGLFTSVTKKITAVFGKFKSLISNAIGRNPEVLPGIYEVDISFGDDTIE